MPSAPPSGAPAFSLKAQTCRTQTNSTLPASNDGKVERFNRILLEEWAYARLYRSDTERCRLS